MKEKVQYYRAHLEHSNTEIENLKNKLEEFQDGFLIWFFNNLYLILAESMISLLEEEIKDLKKMNMEIRSRHYALEEQGVVDQDKILELEKKLEEKVI